MLSWVLAMFLSQNDLAQNTPEPQEIVRPQTVQPLPAALDTVPVFNSNSPEKIEEAGGILLSTFSPEGKAAPEAHLDYPLTGRFDIFAHHVYGAAELENLTSMYLGILVQNLGTETVILDVLAGASYLSQPDAPFTPLPDFVPFSPRLPVFAGPGSRVMGDLLQDQRQALFPPTLTIPAGESVMLLNQPIPVATLEPPLNGRSTLIRLRSSGPVSVASLAQLAGLEPSGDEVAPTLEQWQTLLETGELATPRDQPPTPIEAVPTQVIYGRVAGVSEGASWVATVTDGTDAAQLTIPSAGEAVSYGISTLYAGQLGTGQIQTAPMLVRYPDTAYQAHGNYGVEYALTFPLVNPTDEPKTIKVAFETPIKEDTLSTDGLRFFEPLPIQTFFRGPLQVRYRDDQGLPRIRNIHLVQKRGQQGAPLAEITLQPQEQRTVVVRLLYPPDATPPQVITIMTQPE